MINGDTNPIVARVCHSSLMGLSSGCLRFACLHFCLPTRTDCTLWLLISCSFPLSAAATDSYSTTAYGLHRLPHPHFIHSTFDGSLVKLHLIPFNFTFSTQLDHILLRLIITHQISFLSIQIYICIDLPDSHKATAKSSWTPLHAPTLLSSLPSPSAI